MAVLSAEQGEALADAEGDLFRSCKWWKTPARHNRRIRRKTLPAALTPTACSQMRLTRTSTVAALCLRLANSTTGCAPSRNREASSWFQRPAGTRKVVAPFRHLGSNHVRIQPDEHNDEGYVVHRYLPYRNTSFATPYDALE